MERNVEAALVRSTHRVAECETMHGSDEMTFKGVFDIHRFPASHSNDKRAKEIFS